MSEQSCPCRQVEPYSGTHDLQLRLTPPVTGAYRLLERTADLTIRCRGCGTAWNGDVHVGGGIYGDVEWTRLCEDGPELVVQARHFADEAHGDQRYGVHPYVVHLDEVVAVLRELGHSRDELICAAYLHDVIEDTDVVEYTVAASFGHDVAALVAFCTDAEGSNRKTRKARTYARMKEVLASGAAFAPDAVAVKLADRIANVRSCQARDNRGLLEMYRREQAALREALYHPEHHASAWAALERALEG